jgi:23S rRNA (uracil1939-C5)-methyltransferase
MKLPTQLFVARVDSLAHDGRGVARLDGKAVFIEGALPGEEVRFAYSGRRRRFDEGRTVEVLVAAPERVAPRCPHFGVCGGCALQHLHPAAQVRHKQQLLLDNLRHIGKVEPEELLAPVIGTSWGYRQRARLGAKHVRKKGRVLVGFRERQGRYLADLRHCDVLHPAVGTRLTELAELIDGLVVRDQVPQIEVAVGDEAAGLVFRMLADLEGADRERLRAYGERTGLQIYIQPGGPDSVYALYPQEPRLSYRLPAHEVEIFFAPTDFTQVNAEINRRMVDRALALLEPQPQERILDLFCGLGNFTLPIARRAGEVLGVEGEAGLVERACANARHNGIGNARFAVADLAGEHAAAPFAGERFDKVLLDPPRTGADAVLEAVAATGAERLVYVSCNPATLARDAGILVGRDGYRLTRAGVMDMFPHTAHVESIAAFERTGKTRRR